MAAPPRMMTILFVDICGSTSIYENLGDVKAHYLISQALTLMQANVEAKGGWVVKTIGDEIMACFWHPIYALDAAKAINAQLADQRPEPGMPMVSVHSGLEHGLVVFENEDVFGDAVNVAARLTSMAKPWQILTTDKTVEALGPDSAESVRGIIRIAVRGKTEEVNVCEVLWRADGLTSVGTKPLASDITKRLMLTQGIRRLEVNHKRPVATLGRDPQNDLVVTDAGVSRWHARVEFRRGKFFLVDKSTNGTFICAHGKQLTFLNYDEYLLPAKGTIILGAYDENDQTVTFTFEVC